MTRAEADDGAGQADTSADDQALSDEHSQLAQSRLGRAAICVLLAIGAVWIVAPSMPGGPFRESVDWLWTPATNIGLEQDWGVFSPNPRDISIDVRADMVYADGTVEVWDVPEFDPLIGAYREYRWNKWQERIRLNARSDLWDQTAVWLAENHQRDGSGPVEIRLIRRWIDHRPVTADGALDLTIDQLDPGDVAEGVVVRDGWNEFVFYTWTSEPER